MHEEKRMTRFNLWADGQFGVFRFHLNRTRFWCRVFGMMLDWFVYISADKQDHAGWVFASSKHLKHKKAPSYLWTPKDQP